jgi:Family of unknown function (DUF6454)
MRRSAVAAAILGLLVVTQLAVGPAAGSGGRGDDPVVRAFTQVTRSSDWRAAATIDLPFDAEHPQGMVELGDRFFISSVEIVEPTRPCPVPCDGYDRTPGRGVGHLYVVDRDGRLLHDVRLGEGDMYHPGGIDFDGRWLWVPVAEYRPNSAAVVYRVDPATLEVTEAFRVQDHIGGVVRDRVTGRLHGVSWGSRRMYEWTSRGRQLAREPNESHFVDYQDCDYVAAQKMLCGGIAGLTGAGGASFELGGLALVDLRTGELLHEVPVQRYSPASGHVVTRNPVALERTPSGLRLYTAPDDEQDGALLVYDLAL